MLGRNFCAAKTCETWLNEAKSSNQQAALAELATDSWKVAFQSATELGEQGYQLWRNLEGIATEMSDSKVSMAEFWAQVTQPKSDTQV